jgi:hypothetical protein
MHDVGVVKPQGTYTWWRWPADAAGASSLAWDLTLLRDPGPTTYFWAHSWWFQGGDVGYFGLQAHDRRDDGSQGRLAVFSVWSAIGCGDNPGCHPGVEGSPFWTCRLPYRWQPGRAYRLRVARARAGWWRASVADLAGGTRTTVGGIRVPAAWGGLDLTGRGSAMWVEFYAANAPGGVAACELVPAMPTGSAKASAPTRGSATTATGSSTRWASRLSASSDPGGGCLAAASSAKIRADLVLIGLSPTAFPSPSPPGHAGGHKEATCG